MTVIRSREKILIKLVCGFLMIGFVVSLLVLTKPHFYVQVVTHGERSGSKSSGSESSGSESSGRFAREDVECPSLHFSTVPLPRTAIASFPGSGNTWFRHILQLSSGIATGSVYMDKSLAAHGFPGEKVTNSSVLGIKTHYLYNQHIEVRFERAVILMRNPYETILACFKYTFSHKDKHTAHVNLDVFINYWKRAHLWTSYFKFYLSWLQHNNSFLVFYDDLKHNLEETLVQLKHFLVLPNEFNVECGLRNSLEMFQRNHTGLPLSFYFSKEQRLTINQLILDLKNNYTRKFQLKSHPFDTWLMDVNV